MITGLPGPIPEGCRQVINGCGGTRDSGATLKDFRDEKSAGWLVIVGSIVAEFQMAAHSSSSELRDPVVVDT